jgi:hypothetical protein
LVVATSVSEVEQGALKKNERFARFEYFEKARQPGKLHRYDESKE